MSTLCATVRRLSAPTPERPGGAQVSPLGTYKATVTKVRAGNVQLMEGALFWRRYLRKKLAAEQAEAAAAQTPSYGNRGYLALTDDDLILVGVDASVRVKLTEPLLTISRTQVAYAEIGKAGVMLGSLPLRITLANGDEWVFEVPRVVRRKGKQLVAELGECPHTASTSTLMAVS